MRRKTLPVERLITYVASELNSQKLRPTIHELITSEIKARAAAIDASRPRLDQVLKTVINGPKSGRHVGGSGTSFKKPQFRNETYVKGSLESRPFSGAVTPSMGLMGAGQAAAQDLLESLLGHVSQILGNARSSSSALFIIFMFMSSYCMVSLVLRYPNHGTIKLQKIMSLLEKQWRPSLPFKMMQALQEEPMET